jgi:hypothetical protein
MIHTRKVFGVAALAATLGLLFSCGGGGGGGASGIGGGGGQGTAHVLLTDDPAVSVNGHTFDQVNVTFREIAFEDANGAVSPFQTVALSGPTNLLALANSNDWAGAFSLAAGTYRAVLVKLDPAGTLHELGASAGTTISLAVDAGPNGIARIPFVPALVVDPAVVAIAVLDWRVGGRHGNPGALRFDPATGTYTLDASGLVGFSPPRGTPLPVRAVPLRIDEIGPGPDEFYARLLVHHTALRIRVDTSGATIEDENGNPIALSQLAAGDRVIAAGSVNDRADLVATSVHKLPPPGPHHHNHAFALGVITSVDASAETFVIDTPNMGPVPVHWSANTRFFSVAPPPGPGLPPAVTPRGAPGASDIGKHAGAGGTRATIGGVPGIEAIRAAIEQ